VSLRSELVSLRTTLKSATAENVYIRDDLPFDSSTSEYTPPSDTRHVILDLIPSAPAVGINDTIPEDLVVQISAWSNVSLTDAIDLAEDCRAAAEVTYARTGGVQFAPRDGEWRGVVFTITSVAAFDAFNT
jgi:hypothetical protein